MIRPVVEHVAALAEALEIAPPVISRIMIEVRRRQYDAGLSHLPRLNEIRPPRPSTPGVPPSMAGRIEPATIWQTADSHSMRATASLTQAGGTLEAHAPADFRPIAWIYSPHFKFDWHSHTYLC